VSHCGLAKFTWKSILRQKENDENSSISPCNKHDLQKKSSKRNQNPPTYHNSTIKSQVSPQAKISSSFRNPHIKLDLLLLPRGQNPLSYYTIL
jgi:hypothetical protein